MKKLKQKQGITLIALLITIIVLLILAGITINLTLGQDGIIKMAQNAGKNYVDVAEQERDELAKLTNTADEIINNITGGNGGGTPTVPETPTIDESVLALKAGDYIKYDSGKNGVITCRVLYPANSEYGLQIISDQNVKSVTLGSNFYSGAVASYNNAIETLNNEAENYINTEYAYDARCVGSAPTIQNGMFINKDKVKFEGTTEYIVPSDANYYKLPFATSSYINSYATDINYEIDKTQMETAGIWNIGKNYWIASRLVGENSSQCNFYVRNVNTSGILNSSLLCIVYSDGGTYGGDGKAGLRPCIFLKSDIIKITSGDGKSADTAYVIGK